MRLGLETNGSSNELMMQEKFETWIESHNKKYSEQVKHNSRYNKFIIQYFQYFY